MNYLNHTDFPTPERGLVRARRAPVFFRPILGSSEQLLVGVVAYNDFSAHLERANCLERLNCFYGEQANGAIWAIELSLDEIASDIATNPISLSADYIPAMSCISIGSHQEAEGGSLESIASSWLAGMSSLYTPKTPNNGELVTLAAVAYADNLDVWNKAADRLGKLLLNYVVERNPKLKSAFSPEIQSNARRRRGVAHQVFIDFSGSKIAANFGILATNNYGPSIDRIKRRMWDLKIVRDEDKSSFFKRDHEMIVQHPPENDPQLSARQIDTIMESVRGLEKQADQEEIRFRPMHRVEDIGDHLMQREAA